MIYTDNKTLIKEFKKLLIDKGIKQQFIADSLEISKQSLNLKLNKKHVSLKEEKLRRKPNFKKKSYEQER